MYVLWTLEKDTVEHSWMHGNSDVVKLFSYRQNCRYKVKLAAQLRGSPGNSLLCAYHESSQLFDKYFGPEDTSHHSSGR